jgi:hypothetical protein
LWRASSPFSLSSVCILVDSPRVEHASFYQAADWISPVNAARTASSRSGIGEAALVPQPRKNPIKEDAALLNGNAVGGGSDGPKLRIGEGDHAAMVLPTRAMSTAIVFPRNN